MRRAVSLLSLCGILLAAPTTQPAAQASDFWDAVRNPGLAKYHARLRAAREALHDNRPAHALEAADSALVLLADRPEAHVLRGQALAARRDFAEAQEAFERALAIDPSALDSADAGLAAATTAMRLDDLGAAADLLARTLATLRDAAQRAAILTLQADVLQAQGPEHLQRARMTYREARRSNPAGAGALLGLALTFHREGDTDEALLLAAELTVEPSTTTSGRWALPESEQLARRALWLQAIGDLQGARPSWLRAATLPGPWQQHAQRSAAALAPAREASRAQP